MTSAFIAVIPLLLSLTACSETEKVDHRSDDSDTTVSEPAMVGGAFLTCSVSPVAVNDKNVGAGCAVSEEEKEFYRSNDVKVILHNGGQKIELEYQVAYEILDPEDRSWNVLNLPKDLIDGAEIEIIYPDGSSSRSLIKGGNVVAKEDQCQELERYRQTLTKAKEDLVEIETRKKESDELFVDTASSMEKIKVELDKLVAERELKKSQGASDNILEDLDKDIAKASNDLDQFSGESTSLSQKLDVIKIEAERRVQVATKAFNEVSNRIGTACNKQ